jgi:uncharacterized protein (DUF1800 family)
MLTDSSAFAAPRLKARQPAEFVIGACRALGLRPQRMFRMPSRRFHTLLIDPMRLMGQEWGRPIGPDGWAEAAAEWITPQGLGARIAWAMDMPGNLEQVDQIDPRAFLDHALGTLAPDTLRVAVSRAESAREGVGLVMASPEFNRR